MTYRCIALAATLLASTAGLAEPAKQPRPPAPRPVTETHFGIKVIDPYRFMEKLDASTLAWMKAQGDYTRDVMDSIAPRAALLKRLASLSGSFTFAQSVQLGGGRVFYQQRASGSDNYDLMVHDADGAMRKLVDIAALRAANGGKPYAINYYLASPAGDKVAVGISEGGSEDAALTVLDVATGRQIAGPVPRMQFGLSGWNDDGTLLYLNQLADLPAIAPGTDKFRNTRAMVWDLTTAPTPLIGGATPSAIKVVPERIPYVVTGTGATIARAEIVNGTQNELEIWTTPAAAASRADAPWTRLTTTDDDVTRVTMTGNHLFLLSHRDAPTFKVLTLDAGQPLSAARTLVPVQPGRLIEGIAAAKDGLYVLARKGLYSQLTRISYGSTVEQPIALPVRGSVSDLWADAATPGISFTIDSWVTPPTAYAYDGARLTDLKVFGAPTSFDPARYAIADLQAKAVDGTMVPMSHVTAKGATGTRPLLLFAYGSYGSSMFPYFATRWAALLGDGIDVAVCHVRGGGELGEAWRLAGKDANKPNTWRDAIACGRDLVRRGITTPKQLFLMGGSAGGITVGRAIEEAPGLFAGAFDMVPVANTTRMEFSPNGVPNIPEFGTVTTEAGFRNLYAMDSYLHVEKDKRYTPVMLTTGLNDPRVSPWQPAKFAARLLAAGPTPVLLRIDAEAGHGMGATKTQADEMNADVIAYIRWHLGDRDWQPAR